MFEFISRYSTDPVLSNHSSIKPITGYLVSLSNSVLFAFFNLQTFLENSITAACIPKHIPKKGTLFSLAYFIAFIFPSIPLPPKPPGTIMPPAFAKDE